jgi:hypothetical protein
MCISVNHWPSGYLTNESITEEDDSLNPSDCNAMQKVLVQESQSFVQQVEELYKAPNCKWDARATSIADGPALMLAMDDKIAQRLQQLSVEHQDRCDVPRVNVLDRDHLGKEFLVCYGPWESHSVQVGINFSSFRFSFMKKCNAQRRN